jgi:hypothetical protein
LRRIAAAALSAAALSAALVATTTGTASATGTYPVGGIQGATAGFSALAGSVGSKIVGPRHHFSVSTRGSSVSGDWFKVTGVPHHPSMIGVEFTITDTKADGLSAGACFDYTSKWNHSVSGRCAVDTLGYHKSISIHWLIFPSDHLRLRAATGRLDTVKHLFMTRYESGFITVR